MLARKPHLFVVWEGGRETCSAEGHVTTAGWVSLLDDRLALRQLVVTATVDGPEETASALACGQASLLLLRSGLLCARGCICGQRMLMERLPCRLNLRSFGMREKYLLMPQPAFHTVLGRQFCATWA